MPAMPEEAFALLDAKLTADEKNELLQAEDSTDFHFGLGLWIRNNLTKQRVIKFRLHVNFLGKCKTFPGK